MKQSRNQNEKRNLGQSLSIATAIMVGSVLLSRITGLIREQVLAGFQGTSYEMDAYVTAFLIPELLNHFLAGGFLSITFIPIFQRYMLQEDHRGGWRCFSNLLTVGSVLFLILTPVLILLAPQILGHIADPQRRELTVRLTRIILPAQILFYWGAFFSAVQMANHRFFLPAMAPLCYNVGIIAGGVLLGPRLGIEGFAWGVLIGAFFGNVVLQIPGARAVGMVVRWRFDLSDPDLKRYVLLTLPLVLGLGMTFSNEIFFRFFGSFLSEGATSSVNYALRTMMIVVAVFGQASGVASYPFLSRLAAERQFERMTVLLNSVLSRIAVYLLPLSGIMIVLAPEIIAILFERGSFTIESTYRTAPVFAVYLTGAFFFSSSMIVVRLFYARQNTVFPMIVSSTVALLTVPLYIVLSRRLSGLGMALAAVLGMTAQFLVLYIAWHLGQRENKALLHMSRKFGAITLVSLFGAAVTVAARTGLRSLDFDLPRFLQCTIVAVGASVPALAAVAITYEVTGLHRVRDLIGAFGRRRGSE